MSQYYKPRTSTPSCSSSSSDIAGSSSAQPQQAPVVDLNQSIYIFPSPSSSSGFGSPNTAWTPAATTDLSFPLSLGSRTRSVSGSRSRSAGRGDPRPDGTGLGSIRPRGERFTSFTTDESGELEVWGWTVADADTDGQPSDGSLSPLEIELEEAVERASRWDIVSRPLPLGGAAPGSLYPYAAIPAVSSSVGSGSSSLASIRRPAFPGNARLRTFSVPRTRTTSHLSNTSLGSPSGYSRSASAGPSSLSLSRPHPRIHIPLLALFATFLGIEDGTLQLLTAAPTGSALFDGQGVLADEEDDDGPDERLHGMVRLLCGPENLERESAASLKRGCAVACDASVTPDVRFFALPRVGIGDVWSFASGAWTHGRRVWREAWP